MSSQQSSRKRTRTAVHVEAEERYYARLREGRQNVLRVLGIVRIKYPEVYQAQLARIPRCKTQRPYLTKTEVSHLLATVLE